MVVDHIYNGIDQFKQMLVLFINFFYSKQTILCKLKHFHIPSFQKIHIYYSMSRDASATAPTVLTLFFIYHLTLTQISSRGAFKLAVVKLCIKTVLFQKLFMGSLFNDVAILHNQNEIRILDG